MNQTCLTLRRESIQEFDVTYTYIDVWLSVHDWHCQGHVNGDCLQCPAQSSRHVVRSRQREGKLAGHERGHTSLLDQRK